MKFIVSYKHPILFVAFYLFLCTNKAYSQHTYYIIGENPDIFLNLENQLKQDETDTIITLCDQIITQSTDPKTRGIAFFYKGQAERQLNGPRSFSPAYQNAIQYFKAADFRKGLAMAYCKEADRHFFQQQFEKADSLYNLSVSLSEKLTLRQPLIDAYQKKANISTYQNEPESAIIFLKKALTHALRERNRYQAKDIINQISTNYHAGGQLDSAIFYFQKLLSLKKEMKDSEGLISDYSALGNLFRERGDYENAQQNLLFALTIAESEHDTFSMVTIYSEIGDVHAAQNMWTTAGDYYNNALDLAKLKKRRFAEAGCYKKIGDLYRLQDNEEAAIANYEAALEIYNDLNNKTKAADVLIQLSKIYKKGNEFTKAKNLLLEALAVRKNSQDLMSTLSAKQALAAIEISNGDVRKGIAYAEECLEAYEDMKDKEGLKGVALLLAEAYAKMGDYKRALGFYQKFSAAKDSLTSIERAKVIKEFDLLYNTEKKDKEIAQQNEKIKTQQVAILQKNNQLLLLAGGLALLALTASLLFFVYLKNKQINQQRIAVLEKEKETQRLKSIIEGEEKERKRFARELHDGLGAVLATVKMQVSGISHSMPEAVSLSSYQKANDLIDGACRTVREISHNLMPYVLEQQGLFFAMEDMCQNLARHNDTDFDFISFGDEVPLSDVLKITLFRITQELLKNIIKHADAKEVIVQLTIEPDEVMLIVEDDGKGFDPAAAKNGIGLENIRSRINYLQGILEIDSRKGEGSTFTVQLPVTRE